MKIKLEKTIDVVDGTTWYAVYADNEYLSGDRLLTNARKIFDLAKKTKGKLKETEIIAEEEVQDDYASIY
jgi:hypothetical protein